MGLVVLEILQPSQRAEELVAAVAEALGVEPVRGEDLARFDCAAMAYPVARTKAVRALSRAGDPGGEVVRVLEGQ
jgi:hypothetical protein